MDIDTLARLIHGLRCANLVLWLWIGMGSVAPIRRILGRTTVQGDWLGGTLFLLAASLITFQIRSLARGIEPPADPMTAAGLAGLVLTALAFQLNRDRMIPDDHRRAAIASHLGLAALAMAAGALS